VSLQARDGHSHLQGETRYTVPSVWFNIWLVRGLTWLLTLLPSVVLLIA
jgi:hypothetical protein